MPHYVLNLYTEIYFFMKRRRDLATIKDIAEVLQISPSTVSKALNNATDISESLRQKVLDVAVEMGYHTKASRKLENRKLAILVQNMEYEEEGDFGFDIVLGFNQAAFRHSWKVDVIKVTPEMEETEKYDNFLLANSYSGAYLLGFTLDDPWFVQAAATTLPTIFLDNFIRENPKVGELCTDSNEGISLLLTHLLELGHTKIGFFTGPSNSNVFRIRRQAFLRYMTYSNHPVKDHWVIQGDIYRTSAANKLDAILNGEVTAIICSSDEAAIGVISECIRKGLRVPEDISVVGFDDIPAAANCTPPLTTVHQSRTQLGSGGFIALNSLLEGLPVSLTTLRPHLVIRSSTAPVRKED